MLKRETLTNPRTLALTGVMTAVIFVLTYIVHIPTPGGGYIHFGDAGVLFTGFAFGPVVGTVASALGTAFSDLFGGYAQWAPYTLIIHGLMGFAAAYLARTSSKLWRLLLAASVCGIILVVGYLLAGLILEGAASVADIPWNIVQIVVGALVGVPLFYAVRRAYPPLIRDSESD